MPDGTATAAQVAVEDQVSQKPTPSTAAKSAKANADTSTAPAGAFDLKVASSFHEETANAVARAGETAAEALADAYGSFIELGSKRASAAMEGSRRLMDCRTPDEVFNAYSSYWTEMLETYADFNTQIMRRAADRAQRKAS